MNQQEKVEFFKNELERAKRNFPSNSQEVHAAEMNYKRAVDDGPEEGNTRIAS
jgi:hypothetical protein